MCEKCHVQEVSDKYINLRIYYNVKGKVFNMYEEC